MNENQYKMIIEMLNGQLLDAHDELNKMRKRVYVLGTIALICFIWALVT